MIKKTRIFLLAILSVFYLQAQQVTHTIPPSDDTYTYSNSTIRGMEDVLKTYHSTAGSQYRRISFLKFDISGLSSFVEGVKLRLYCNGFAAGGDNAHQFDLYPVQINTWSEDDLTFANLTEKAGADITSPVLASYAVPAGQAFDAQYIEFSGENLTRYIADSLAAGKQYISIRMREKYVVKNGSSAVVVEFHSKENASEHAPQLVIEEKDVSELKATDIRIDGTSIDGFSENTYRYVYQLPYDATNIPVVSATAKYPETATVSVAQAVNLKGTENERTAKVTIQKGTDALTYSIAFELLPPTDDARLSEITVSGKPIEFFDKDLTAYTVYLPYTEADVPTVTAIPYEPNATFAVTNASAVDAAASETDRTTKLTVTSGDGSHTKVYTVLFERLPELDIILAIGQSNMAGRADYSAYTGGMDSVYLLTPTGELEVASNPMNRYSNIRKDISLQKLGPSYACALKLKEYTGKPVAFVVNAQGGSSITTWYQAGKGNYDASITRALEARRFGKIRAVIWHQGESDSSNPGSYMGRLKTMVQSLRNDLSEPDLFFIAGELAYWRGDGTGSDAFNAVIRNISAEIDNSDWVSAEGCTPLIDASDPHFDTPSAVLMGERYAAKVIEHVYNTTAVQEKKTNKAPTVQIRKNGLTINNGNLLASYRLFDVSGRLLRQDEINENQSINLTVNGGIYFLNITQSDNIQTVKLIIQ